MADQVNPAGAAEPATPPKKKWEWLWDFRGKFLAAVAGILVTAPTAYYIGRWNNRLQKLEYSVDSSPGILKRPDLQDKSFQVIIDGKPVDNLSTVRVTCLNRTTDNDYASLPLEITFASAGGGTPPKLIQAKALSAPSTAPLLPTPPQTQPTTSPSGPLRLQYILPVVNRSDKAVFVGDYTFEGSEAPTVEIAIAQKGVEAKQIEYGRKAESSYYYTIALLSLTMNGLLIFDRLIVLLFRRLAEDQLQRKWKEDRLRAEAAQEPPHSA